MSAEDPPNGLNGDLTEIATNIARATDVLEKQRWWRRAVIVALATLLVTVLLLAWGQWGNRQIAQDIRRGQVSDACSNAAVQKFPRLLADNVELNKAITYIGTCNRINGVRRPPITLPP